MNARWYETNKSRVRALLLLSDCRFFTFINVKVMGYFCYLELMTIIAIECLFLSKISLFSKAQRRARG